MARPTSGSDGRHSVHELCVHFQLAEHLKPERIFTKGQALGDVAHLKRTSEYRLDLICYVLTHQLHFLTELQGLRTTIYNALVKVAKGCELCDKGWKLMIGLLHYAQES